MTNNNIKINEVFEKVEIKEVKVFYTECQLPWYAERVNLVDTQGNVIGSVNRSDDLNNLHKAKEIVQVDGYVGENNFSEFFALMKSERDIDEEARWDLVRAYMKKTPVTVKLEGIPVKVSLFDEDIVKTMGNFKFTYSLLYEDLCETIADPLNRGDFLIEKGTPCAHKWWQTKCPICGKVEGLIHDVVISYGERVVVNYDEGSVEELCSSCKTIAAGSGLDGKRDKLILNHGLWAYSKNEPTTQGLIKRVLEFASLPASTQICCTERNKFVGGFGVTLKFPEIKAAFGYDHDAGCDAWSKVEDDGERYATRNLDRGVQTLSQYKKEVKKNKELGGYIEVIAKVNVEQDVTCFWANYDFAIGHPHFVMTLAYVASLVEAPLYVVNSDGDGTKWVPVDAFIEKVVNDGFNVMCRHEVIDGTTWGHFDYDRSALRWYLFSLVTKRAEQNAQCEKQAVIVCGLPGSGKSTFIKEELADYVTVDPDVIKWLLPEYDGGDASQVHKESVKLSTWINQYLVVKGVNLAIQTTSPSTVEDVNEMLQALQYDVDVQFIDVDPETCLERIQGRKRSMNVTLEELAELREDIVVCLKYMGYYDDDDEDNSDDDE